MQLLQLVHFGDLGLYFLLEYAKLLQDQLQQVKVLFFPDSRNRVVELALFGNLSLFVVFD